ncbi:hypothetical protein JI664_04055 [Rhodobacter sp. NTK016B]|uniref:glycosyltransferase family protein n=1 Tax=Rhodobacter sp. NTK016B TaxID=2759676 RepID=UPI001A8DD88C|nr:glycosyltransferase [Rhodobacter sp. NTK016B]MBN8291132.1 hypothetical protein [Rhodobacter sp. NTK016B]
MSEQRKTVYFIINLLQDVNVVRGLVYLTVRETDAAVGFLISDAFITRDGQKIWQKELAQLAAETGASLHRFGAISEAYAVLQGGSGMIFAASESNLNAHWQTHDVLRAAPPGYLRVTLQHGFECVGFRQSREHVVAHGRNINFAADVVCSWFEPSVMTALPASERAKLYVSGPPMLLLAPNASHPDHPPQNGGMVCENLHSVRLSATGDHKASFMDIFFDFCAEMRKRDAEVTLRPHPGGQYVLRNNIELPANVRLNNLPMYHVNLRGYDYGISAPSTVVFDMVLAGIPVGVWRDSGGVMDAGNYDGLAEISTLDDWLAFERDVRLRPDMLIERQNAFLRRLQMPSDPAEVYRRFARLLVAGTSGSARPVPPPFPVVGAGPATKPAEPKRITPKRLLFVANALIPTLQLSFLKPLKPLFDAGEIEPLMLTGDDLKDKFGKHSTSAEGRAWFIQQIAEAKPDLIVCCRYSAAHAGAVLEYGRKNDVPVIFHVDDDLLNIPREIGEKKWIMHNNPARIQTVTTLLNKADLRYCSTRKLKDRFRQLNFFGPAVAGQIYCASTVMRPAERGPVRKVGYMGFDHAHDFEIALPALVRYLHRNPEVTFELFGSIPLPDQLRPFGDRVVEVAPVRDYAAFLQTLADRKWDIGICPLAQTAFNEVKANTKWVEYTACGMATIASRGLVYDECAAGGRGRLIGDDAWEEALQELTDNPDERYATALRAQQHLETVYSSERLKEQVLDVFDTAARLVEKRKGTAQPAPMAALRRTLTPEDLGLAG